MRIGSLLIGRVQTRSSYDEIGVFTRTRYFPIVRVSTLQVAVASFLGGAVGGLVVAWSLS